MGMSPVLQVWPKPSCGAHERGKKTRQTEKEGEDNIKEWTGLEFVKSLRAVEKREKWRKLVVKSSMVFQLPARLRDR